MKKLYIKKLSIKKVLLIVITILLTISLLLFLLLFDNSKMNISNINVDNNITDIYNNILFESASNNDGFSIKLNGDSINNILYLINRNNKLNGEENFVEINNDNYTFKITNDDITKSKTIIYTKLKYENNNLEFNIKNIKLSNLYLPNFISNMFLKKTINDNLIKSFNNVGLNIKLDLNNKKIIYPLDTLISDYKNIIKSNFANDNLIEIIYNAFKDNNNLNINNGLDIKLNTINLEDNINDIISFDLETLINENRNYFIKNNSINYEKLYYVYNYFLYGYNYINDKYNKYDPYYILLKEEIDKINFKNTHIVNNIDPRVYEKGYLKDLIDDSDMIFTNNLDDISYLFDLIFEGDRKYPFIEIYTNDLNNYLKVSDTFKLPIIITSFIDNTYKVKILSIHELSFNINEKLALTLSINLNGKLLKLDIPLELYDEDFFKCRFLFNIDDFKINNNLIKPNKSLLESIFKSINFSSRYMNISNDDYNYYLNIDVIDLTRGTPDRESNYKFFTNGKSQEELNYYVRLKDNKIQFIIDNSNV